MAAPPAQRPGRTLIALALMALVATVLVRFPAHWALALAPQGIGCELPSGSLWQGGCKGLKAAGLSLQSATWQLHPLALLRARLSLDVQVDDARVTGHARIAFSPGGTIDLQDLHAHLPIDPGLLPLFPRGWGGELALAIDAARLVHGHPATLRGAAHAQGLRQLSTGMAFGDYVLRFEQPPDATGRLLGQLADEGGPLALSGQLQLASDGQYELNGLVAARPEANAALAHDLEVLGPADAGGRRPFSVAGSF